MRSLGKVASAAKATTVASSGDGCDGLKIGAAAESMRKAIRSVSPLRFGVSAEILFDEFFQT
jgi:hypothetical protein